MSEYDLIEDDLGELTPDASTNELSYDLIEEDLGILTPDAAPVEAETTILEDTGDIAAVGGAGATTALLGISESVWRTPDMLKRGYGALYSMLFQKELPDEWNPIAYVSEGFTVGDYKIEGTTALADRIGGVTKALPSMNQTFADVSKAGQDADIAFDEALGGEFSKLGDVVTDPKAWSGFIGQAAPSLYAAWKSGGSIPFMAWLEGMEQASSASDFEERTGQKIDDQTYITSVAATGLANGLLEKMGLETILKGKGSLVRRFFGGLVGEGGTEGGQAITGNALSLMYDENASLTEGVLPGIMGGAGTGGPAGFIGGVADKMAAPVDNLDAIRKKVVDDINIAESEEQGLLGLPAPVIVVTPEGMAATEANMQAAEDLGLRGTDQTVASQLGDPAVAPEGTIDFVDPDMAGIGEPTQDFVGAGTGDFQNWAGGIPFENDLSEADQVELADLRDYMAIVTENGDTAEQQKTQGEIDTFLKDKLAELQLQDPDKYEAIRGEDRSFKYVPEDMEMDLSKEPAAFTEEPLPAAELPKIADEDYNPVTLKKNLKTLQKEKRENDKGAPKTVLHDIASGGGIDWDMAVAEGMDPADMKAANKKGMPFGKPLFKKGSGNGFDWAAERFSEIGVQGFATGETYQDTVYGANDALDLIGDQISGKADPAYMPGDEIAEMDRQDKGKTLDASILRNEDLLEEVDQYNNILENEGQEAADEFYYQQRSMEAAEEERGGEFWVEGDEVTAETNFDRAGETIADLLDQATEADPEAAKIEFENLVDATDAQIARSMYNIINGGKDAKTEAETKQRGQKQGDTGTQEKAGSEEDLVTRARNGDKAAQEQLKKYGLKWDGDKTKYRKVNKAEADLVLAGEAVTSNRESHENSGKTDITDNKDYGAVPMDSDHRITFKQTDRFDTDKISGETDTQEKNVEAGEYWLENGYSLDDVETIEQEQADGSWKVIYDGSNRRHDKKPVADDQREGDRRTHPGQRKRVSDMSEDEKSKALLTNEKSGLRNERAYNEDERLAHQSFFDIDNFKQINDQFTYDGADKILAAFGEIMAAAGNEFVVPYHLHGDEFIVQSNSPLALKAFSEKVQKALNRKEVIIEFPNGEIKTATNIGASYGIGKTKEQAESGLKKDKAERAAAGLRTERERDTGGLPEQAAGQGQDTEGQVEAKKDLDAALDDLGELLPGATSADEITAAAAEAEGHTASQAQIDAGSNGNFKKGHLFDMQGFKISIENEAGTKRNKMTPAAWPPLAHHYGDLTGTTGADGDPIDVFIKQDSDVNSDHPIYVINQNDKDGDFDEHKVMIGFDSAEDAKQGYLDSYSDDFTGFGNIVETTSEQLKSWIQAGETYDGVNIDPFEYSDAAFYDGMTEQEMIDYNPTPATSKQSGKADPERRAVGRKNDEAADWSDEEIHNRYPELRFWVGDEVKITTGHSEGLTGTVTDILTYETRPDMIQKSYKDDREGRVHYYVDVVESDGKVKNSPIWADSHMEPVGEELTDGESLFAEEEAKLQEQPMLEGDALRNKLEKMADKQIDLLGKDAGLRISDGREATIERIITVREGLAAIEGYKSTKEIKAQVMNKDNKDLTIVKANHFAQAVMKGSERAGAWGTDIDTFVSWANRKGGTDIEISETVPVEAKSEKSDGGYPKKLPLSEKATQTIESSVDFADSQDLPQWAEDAVVAAANPEITAMAKIGYDFRKHEVHEKHLMPDYLSDPFGKINDIISHAEMADEAIESIGSRGTQAENIVNRLMALAETVNHAISPDEIIDSIPGLRELGDKQQAVKEAKEIKDTTPLRDKAELHTEMQGETVESLAERKKDELIDIVQSTQGSRDVKPVGRKDALAAQILHWRETSIDRLINKIPNYLSVGSVGYNTKSGTGKVVVYISSGNDALSAGYDPLTPASMRKNLTDTELTEISKAHKGTVLKKVGKAGVYEGSYTPAMDFKGWHFNGEKDAEAFISFLMGRDVTIDADSHGMLFDGAQNRYSRDIAPIREVLDAEPVVESAPAAAAENELFSPEVMDAQQQFPVGSKVRLTINSNAYKDQDLTIVSISEGYPGEVNVEYSYIDEGGDSVTSNYSYEPNNNPFAAVAEDEFDLTGQTSAEILADEQAAAAEAKRESDLDRAAKAEEEQGDFVLAGSDSAVDQAEARGQSNMFDEKEPAESTEEKEAKTKLRNIIGRLGQLRESSSLLNNDIGDADTQSHVMDLLNGTARDIQEKIASYESLVDGRGISSVYSSLQELKRDITTGRVNVNWLLNQSFVDEKPAQKQDQKPEESVEYRKAKLDLDDALGDLGDILIDRNTLKVVPIDTKKLLPVLTRLFDAAFRMGYYKFKDAAKFALDTIRAKFGNEAADAIDLKVLQGAYIAMSSDQTEAEGFAEVGAVTSVAEINEHEATKDETATTSDLEQDRPAAGDQAPGTAEAIPDVGTEPGQAAGQAGEQTGKTGVRKQGDTGLPDSRTAPIRERGDTGVSTETGEFALESSPTRDSDSGRGDNARSEGVSSDRETESQLTEAAAEDYAKLNKALKDQQAADDANVSYGDIDNIRETLPLLHAEQQEDVEFIEARLEDNRGVLITNGTGTGKTFTGLGAIKRMAMLGKDNILITVPSKKIARDWVDTAELFGLKINTLKNTQDSGSGIVITTYANFGQNNSLADREWDLIVPDEAHRLTEGKDAKATKPLQTLRALSGHGRGHYRYAAMKESELVAEMEDLQEKLKTAEVAAKSDQRNQPEVDRIQDKLTRKNAIWQEKLEQHKANREDHWNNQNTKTLMLSASPFAYEKSVDLAEGFLFEYGPEPTSGAYNTPSAQGAFFIEHLGYRMRTGLLTEPEAEVDRGLMQRELNQWLKDEGALRGRRLIVDHDYSREFIAVDDLVGNKIDEGMDWVHERARDKDHPLSEGYSMLGEIMEDQFDYHSRMKLLEAIKARAAIPRIYKHIEMGRQVVIFHSRIQGGGNHPFKFSTVPMPSQAEFRKNGLEGQTMDQYVERIAQFNSAVKEFNTDRSDLVNLDLESLERPIDLIGGEYPGQVVFFNGTVSEKNRAKGSKEFNQDVGTAKIIMLQDDAGREGISLHDTTGKHPRVLMNLGLPVKPTQTIQIEGRIYRVGQMSDAIFEYFNTGTNFERYAFASKIAGRSGTAENLAMGSEARNFEESFIESFEDPNSDNPHKGQGLGGKEADSGLEGLVSQFDKAKTYYFGTQKTSGKRDQREGVDYFATPEPVGLKMVEWAHAQPGEAMLEPSSGHGAIARFFPKNTSNVFVEPAGELASRTALRVTGDVKQQSFEDLDEGGNKFDAIVMNPPYGSGGKTAMDHLAKAMNHLNDGGRIVALIPAGPAADKKFDQLLYGKDNELKTLKNKVKLKTVKQGEYETRRRQLEEFVLVADVSLPAITFKRAGTSVNTHIVVLERHADMTNTPDQIGQVEIKADDVNELFDRIEYLEMPKRVEIFKPEEWKSSEGQGIDWRTLWQTPSDQEYKSRKASINRNKNPVTIGIVEKKLGGWKQGTINADIGGGMHNNTTDYMDQLGVHNVIYDPFNRTDDFNADAVSQIAGGNADTATINNTLNVIKEPDIRNKVLREAYDALKPGGVVYIQIYEGDATGKGRSTQGGETWQENRKPKTYLQEIKAVFPEAEIQYGLIKASKGTIVAAKPWNRGTVFSAPGMTRDETLGDADKVPQTVTGDAKKVKPKRIKDTGGGIQSTIVADKDTRDDSPIWIVKLDTSLDRDRYKQAAALAKSHKGFYSRYKRGMLFKSEADASGYAEALMGMDAGDQDIKLSKSSHVEGKSGKAAGITAAQAEEALQEFEKELKNPAGIDIVTAPTKESIMNPDSLSKYGDDLVKGYYVNRTEEEGGGAIVLILSDLESVNDAVETLRHEWVVHHGLNTFTAADKKRIIDRLRSSKGEMSLKKLWDHIEETYADESPEEQAEEVLAYMAQNKATRLSKLWNDIVLMIQNALRKVGLISKDRTTKAEIIRFIEDLVARVGAGAKQQTFKDTKQPESSVDQTETGAFKRWFGESKVVDENGDPLVVYHGSTYNDIVAFDQNENNPVYYFTKSPGLASVYAEGNRSDIKMADIEAPTVYPVYLSLKNPYIVKNRSRWEKIVNYVRRNTGGLAGNLSANERLRTDEYGLKKSSSTVAPKDLAELQAQGYDGIINDGMSEIIVFSSTSIKSAVGNTGVFDPSSANIMYSRSTSDFVNEVDSRSKGAAAKVKKLARRYFTKEGLLNDASFEAKIAKDADKNVGESDLSALVYDFEKAMSAAYGVAYSKISNEDLKDVNAYLAGERGISLPEGLDRELDGLRAYLDRLSGGMQLAMSDMLAIEAGKLTEVQQIAFGLFLSGSEGGYLPKSLAKHFNLYQTIEKNKGVYLNRSYQAFDDKNWKNKIMMNHDLIQRAKDFIAEQNPELTNDELRGAVGKILESAYDNGNFVSFMTSGAKVGSKDTSIITKRKNVPGVIRELLGEYKDPKLNFVRSASKMQYFVANHNFLMRLRTEGLGVWLYEKPTGEFDAEIATPGSETMNPLNGLHTTREFKEGLEDAANAQEMGKVMRQIIRMNSVIKYGKTILAPTTQARNFMSAAMFTVMNGHFDWSHAEKAFKVAKSDLFTKDAVWREYIQHLIQLGVIHNNPFAGELRDAIKDFTELNVYEKGVMQKPKQFLNFMQKAYQIGDDFWKIIGFENEVGLQMENGLTRNAAEKKAAYRIRNGYPTYSMVPRAVKHVRRWPLIGTFVSFPYEITRTSYNQMEFLKEDIELGHKKQVVRRVMGMSIAASAAYAASMASMMLMGIDDEDDEAVRKLLPEWSRNAQLVYYGYDKNGMPQYYDMSYIDPYTYLKKPISSLLNGNNVGIDDKVWDALKEYSDPFIGVDIAAGTALELISNKKSTGGKIYNDKAPNWDKTKAVMNHARKSLQPGVMSNIERTILALNSETSRGGKQYKVSDEMMAWIGHRFGTLNIPQSMVYKTFQFTDDKKEASMLLGYVAGSQQKISKSEMEKATRQMLKARGEVYNDMIKIVGAAKRLNVSEDDLADILEASGMSRTDVDYILDGDVAPWDMPFSYGEKGLTRAVLTAHDDDRRAEIEEEYDKRMDTIDEILDEWEKNQ